ATVCCLSAKAEATRTDLVRSAVLGRFVWGLAQLAQPAALRTGRHSRSVAAGAFSQVLGASVEGEPQAPRQTRDCRRDSPTDRAGGRVQSAVACATDSRRTPRCLASRSRSEPSRESSESCRGHPARPGRRFVTTTSA